MLPQLGNELPPLMPNMLKESAKELNALILMHLLVQLAVQGITLSGLPTLIMLATINLLHVRFVLSKVKSLSRMNLTSHR